MDLVRSSIIVHLEDGDPQRFSTDLLRERIFPAKRWNVRREEESPPAFVVEYENGIGFRAEPDRIQVSMTYEEGAVSLPVRDLHDGLTRYGQRVIEVAADGGLLGLDLRFSARTVAHDLGPLTRRLPEGAVPIQLTYELPEGDPSARVVQQIYRDRDGERALWVEATFPLRVHERPSEEREEALTDHLARRLECLSRFSEWQRESRFLSEEAG